MATGRFDLDDEDDPLDEIDDEIDEGPEDPDDRVLLAEIDLLHSYGITDVDDDPPDADGLAVEPPTLDDVLASGGFAVKKDDAGDEDDDD